MLWKNFIFGLVQDLFITGSSTVFREKMKKKNDDDGTPKKVSKTGAFA